MALDINNKNPYYLFGRLVAVVERSNNESFTAGQMHNIQDHTATLVQYDRNKNKFMDVRQQIMSLFPAEGWPEKIHEDADGSRFYVGYYHQKSALPMFVQQAEHHHPDSVAPVDSNEIDELRDERPATSD